MLAAGWSEAQKRAYVLADNQLALNAGWNPELLRLELGDLQALEFDLGLIGFDDAQLAALTANPGLTDPDEVPEPPAVPVAQRGDVWALGRHRLMCGDATSGEDVAKALGGVQPHLMVTDPPYGVEYDPKWRERYDQFKRHAVGKVMNDDRADWHEAWAQFPGDVVYVWCAGTRSHEVAGGLESNRFGIRALIVWAKQHFVFGRGDYHEQKEVCWYAVRTGKAGHWNGDRKQTTLWQIANLNPMGGNADEKSTGHGTQKPIECMKRPIENNSSPGQAMYDPFVGSGTTIIAAEMTGRACHAIEINPAYVDVSIERWQNFTGEKARRA